jgi:S1-C subfamily serine protease
MPREILRLRLFLLVTILHASAFLVAAQEPAQTRQGIITTFAPIVEKVAPSVVTVFTTQTVSRGLTTFPFGDDTLRQFFGGQSPQRQGKQTLQGLGSGVIVSPDGYILTANHVVSGAEEIMVGLGTELRKYKARKVGTDPGTDVALLKIDEKNLPAITFTDSEKARAGDIVLSSAPWAAAVWGSLITKISSRRTQPLTWATPVAHSSILKAGC